MRTLWPRAVLKTVPLGFGWGEERVGAELNYEGKASQLRETMSQGYSGLGVWVEGHRTETCKGVGVGVIYTCVSSTSSLTPVPSFSHIPYLPRAVPSSLLACGMKRLPRHHWLA